jgi:hypothetical protein
VVFLNAVYVRYSYKFYNRLRRGASSGAARAYFNYGTEFAPIEIAWQANLPLGVQRGPAEPEL